jgi:hypothetical protein
VFLFDERTSKMKYAKMLTAGLLVLALTMMGCSGKGGTPNGKPKKEGDKNEQHAHGKGPNGGVVFDLGKYHAEFTVDHPRKQCMILILGDDEQTHTPVAAKEFTLTTKATKTQEGTTVEPMTIKLLPTDEKDGKATTFVGTDPGLGNVADFAGTVLGEINGKPSEGKFKE